MYGQVPQFTAGERDVVDLLGAEPCGRLCVLELKASEDVHLPVQALDYWLRVRWHCERGDFTANGYFPGSPYDATRRDSYWRRRHSIITLRMRELYDISHLKSSYSEWV